MAPVELSWTRAASITELIYQPFVFVGSDLNVLAPRVACQIACHGDKKLGGRSPHYE